MLQKYLPALQRLGHDCTEVVKNMVRITYFPQRTEKRDAKYIPSIMYQFSDTRPTMNQLSPYQTKEFRLLPITPIPPILKLLAYVPKRNNSNHSNFPCPNYSCIMCRQYETIINANINVPIISTHHYRPLFPRIPFLFNLQLFIIHLFKRFLTNPFYSKSPNFGTFKTTSQPKMHFSTPFPQFPT